MKTYDEVYWQNYCNYEDLRLYETGCQKCPPSYDFGPIIRDKYILHYIIEGEGIAYLDNKAYPVHEGQAFVLPPHVLTYYQADSHKPWNYIWIQFQGFKAAELLQRAGIGRKNPVWNPDKPCPAVEDCLNDMLKHPYDECRCMGNLYHLFQWFMDSSQQSTSPEEKSTHNPYVNAVITYISQKYSEPLTVRDLSNFCGLDRSYFSKIFKDETGYRPQDYLIEFRMKKAKQLLKDTGLSIQHIAYSVGYNDPLYFSRLFRHKIGLSPLKWRVQN